MPARQAPNRWSKSSDNDRFSIERAPSTCSWTRRDPEPRVLGVEFTVANAIGSVSLVADSIDFLEDTFFNVLILFALCWSARNRARLGLMLALILLVPGLATVWTAWVKFRSPVAPAPLPMSLAGAGALVINLACAVVLA